MFDQIQSFYEDAHQLEIRYWLDHDLFSIHWWIILLINLLFLVLFVFLIDRNRILVISIAFLVSFISIGSIEDLGQFFNLWTYPHEFFAPLKTANAVDFLCIPIVITLVYQYVSRWKYFLFASIIVFAIISFICIPIFVYFDFYRLHNWNYFLSFLSLFIIGLLVKTLTDLVYNKSKQQKY